MSATIPMTISMTSGGRIISHRPLLSPSLSCAGKLKDTFHPAGRKSFSAACGIADIYFCLGARLKNVLQRRIKLPESLDFQEVVFNDAKNIQSKCDFVSILHGDRGGHFFSVQINFRVIRQDIPLPVEADERERTFSPKNESVSLK